MGNNGLLGFSSKKSIIIPQNKILHISASDQPHSDGEAVPILYDSSGYNNHFVQGGADTTRGTFKTNIINGQPVIRFDGGDWYKLGPILTIWHFTFFIVAKAAVQGASNGIYFAGYGGTATNRWVFGSPATAYTRTFVGTTVTKTALSTSSFYTNTPKLAIHAATQDLYNTIKIDGGEEEGGISSPGMVPVPSYANTIGVQGNLNGYLVGDIAEIILYDKKIDDYQESEVKEYLREKYAIW